MATAKWLLGLDGNWADANRWSTGALPASGDSVRINASGTYTVTLSSAGTGDQLFVSQAGATFFETAAGTLAVNVLNLQAGTYVLNGVNTIGATNLSGGLLKAGNGSALGAGLLTLSGGELLASATETITNDIAFEDTSTIAAQHGRVLTLTGTLQSSPDATVIFGEGSNDGTIILALTGINLSDTTRAVFAAGTTRPPGGGGSLSLLASEAETCVVEAGATLDAKGHELSIRHLEGTGTVTNTGAHAFLILSAGDFAGTIGGSLGITVKGDVTLTGDAAPKGGTSISGGDTLTLGDGGTTGSLKGGVSGFGTLAINHSNTVTLISHLSGDVSLSLLGTGTVKINHPNTYTGDTRVNAGTLQLTDADGIGTGELRLVGGKFLSAASLTMTNPVSLAGSGTIAAANGTVLTFNASHFSVNGALTFGAPGEDGTVVFDLVSGGSVSSSTTVDIAAGTLQLADSSFDLFTSASARTTIEAGATLDLLARSLHFASLVGSGSLTTTLGTAGVTLLDADFGGVISGDIHVDITGSAVLTGNNTYTGLTGLFAGTALALGDGGTTGSIVSDLFSKGRVYFNRADTVTYDGVISSVGDVYQFGSGTTRLTAANTYSGFTVVEQGTLVSNHNGSGALGTGEIHMHGGELRGGLNQTLANVLSIEDNCMISAGHNKTLTLTGKALIPGAATHLTIGSAGNDGTVVWTPGSLTSVARGYTLDIAAGTLVDGGGQFDAVANLTGHVLVKAGATLDVAGHFLSLHHLRGAGIIANSGALTAFRLNDGNFAGQINGDIVLNVSTGVTTLSGGGTFGKAIIFNNGTLHLRGDAHEDIAFQGNNAHLIVDNTSKFTGTISDFVSGDTIDLTRIDFGGGTGFGFDAGTDILTVTDGTHNASLQFEDGYTAAEFSLADDGNGHTNVLTSLSTPHAAFLELSPG